MASANNTGSTLTWLDTTNKTSTAVSTNIIIKVNDIAVGAVQKLQITEERGIKPIDEVGTDGHIDSVPNSSTNISGTCNRVRFDRLRIAEAFSRSFIHVASQIYPFDIVILDKQKGTSDAQWISTIIKNVWIKSIDYSYDVTDWVITDNMSWVAETIYSTISGGNNVAQGGERQIINPSVWNTTAGIIERQVDRGANSRRGSLDAAGLIDIGANGDLF